MLAGLLEAYGLEPSDVEPEALARVRDPEHDAEGLRRVVRMAATNRELRRVGLPPLLLAPQDEAVDDAQLCRAAETRAALQVRNAEEREAIEACGLTARQFDQTLRGTFGVVVGLPINESAYRRAMLACRSKAARACGENEEAVRAYMRRILRRMAERALRKNKTHLK
jgi:hypothetical protein